MTKQNEGPLAPRQIDAYLRDGVLVVDDLLSREEIAEARRGLARTLADDCGVDVRDLEGTGRGLTDASSTNGAGGVLDIFYPDWKMKIATNETLFAMTCQLWKEAYCHSGERLEDLARHGKMPMENYTEGSGAKKDEWEDDVSFKWHPFGTFDCDRGYMYIDRIGYRIPTKIALSIGKQLSTSKPSRPTHQVPASKKSTSQKKKKGKARPIQRSLTPHFDCCPETYHDATGKGKWRPIQCFVSLTDNLRPNTGGFEAAPGFHREFRSWAEDGRRFGGGGGPSDGGDPTPSPQSPRPRPCVGEYTHLDPSHDRDLMRRVRHVPVKAGSAVFWDNRIPHANSYRNDPRDDDNGDAASSDVDGDALGTSGSRAVVYCSFLPDVEVNRRFARRQLEDWRARRVPGAGDRWIDRDDDGGKDGGDGVDEDETVRIEGLSELGKLLIGLAEWT